MLDVIKRTCDTDWVAGMLASPDGQAILAAAQAIGAKVSEALDEQVGACQIGRAPTGSPGTCNLVISRSSTTPTGTIPNGFKFVTKLGVELLVSGDVAVANGQANVTLPLQSLRQIDLVNTVIGAFDDQLKAGDLLDSIISYDSPAVVDDSGNPLLGFGADVFGYVSSTPIDGATMNWLAEHGKERGCLQQPGEDGEAYRARVRQIPDAVTPIAVQTAVLGAKSQGQLRELYAVEPMPDQSSVTARSVINLVFADAPYCDDSYCDDPFGADLAAKGPFRTIEMPDMRGSRAYFRESVYGNPIETDGLVFYADESYCDDPMWGYADVGQHPSITAALRAIQEEARSKRAGGVQFDLTIENATIAHGQTAAANPPGSAAVIWSLEAPSGKAWYIREGLVSCNIDGAGAIDPATDEFRIVITQVGGGVLQSDWWHSISSLPIRRSQLEKMGYYGTIVAKIEGLIYSSVPNTLNLVGTFWVTEVTL